MIDVSWAESKEVEKELQRIVASDEFEELNEKLAIKHTSTLAGGIFTAVKLNLVKHLLEKRIQGQEKYVEAVTTALISKSNVFLKSPPGTSKSALVRLLGRLVRDPADPSKPARASAVLMPGLMKTELVGDLDLPSLARGIVVYNLSETARSNVVLFDEMFKADKDLLNTLLNWVNEKLLTIPSPALIPVEDLPFYPPNVREKIVEAIRKDPRAVQILGKEPRSVSELIELAKKKGISMVKVDPPVPVPLIIGVAASNEIPKEEELEALYNRLHIKIFSKYIEDLDTLRRAFESKWIGEDWGKPDEEYAKFKIVLAPFMLSKIESKETRMSEFDVFTLHELLKHRDGNLVVLNERDGALFFPTTEDLWNIKIRPIMEAEIIYADPSAAIGTTFADIIFNTIVLPVALIRTGIVNEIKIDGESVPKFASDRDLIAVLPSLAVAIGLMDGLFYSVSGESKIFLAHTWTPISILSALFKILKWRKWDDYVTIDLDVVNYVNNLSFDVIKKGVEEGKASAPFDLVVYTANIVEMHMEAIKEVVNKEELVKAVEIIKGWRTDVSQDDIKELISELENMSASIVIRIAGSTDIPNIYDLIKWVAEIYELAKKKDNALIEVIAKDILLLLTDFVLRLRDILTLIIGVSSNLVEILEGGERSEPNEAETDESEENENEDVEELDKENDWV